MTDTGSMSGGQPHLPATEEAILALFWLQFNSQFPTERDCVEELYRRADKGLFKCRHCGNPDLQRNYGDRLIKCPSCKKRTWLTAGTFFHRMKTAKPWLAAIWLMEQGIILSSSRFHLLVGIAQSSALHIFKKITTVIQDHMGQDAPSVHSSYFSFVLCKRSRETPARSHPLAELEEIERSSHADLPPTSSSEGPGSTCEVQGKEKEVYELLSETPLHFDSLLEQTRMSVADLSAALTMLELAEFVLPLSGNRYVRRFEKHRHPRDATESDSPRDSAKRTAINIDASIDFIRLSFHGISRKYLQNYLAAYWCRTARTQWRCGSLLRACLRFGPLSYNQILDYVSPPSVKLLPS